jgi:hypothetical protein
MLTAPFNSKNYKDTCEPRTVNRVSRASLPHYYADGWDQQETNRRYKARVLGGIYSEFVENNQAEVTVDKMSLVVTKPGFYYRSHLSKRTERTWDTLVFTKPGRYSLMSLYKHVADLGWGQFYGGAITHPEITALGGNGDIAARSFLLTTIPAIEKSRAEFGETEYGKELLEKLKIMIYNLNKIEEVELPEGILTIDGYVPLISTYKYDNDTDKRTDKCYAIIDGKFKKYTPFKIKKDHAWYLYNIFNNSLNRDYPNFGDHATPLTVAFYADGQIVYSEELMDKLYEYFDENKDLFKTRVKSLKLIKDYFSQPKPSVFKEKFNRYMEDRKLGGFKANEVISGVMVGFWTKHDFDEGHHQHVYTTDIGYYVNVSYNEEKILGPGAKYGGWLFVTEDGDRIRLVHSAWCQHISAWSAYSASVTDQKYSVWCIADWLSGPWAERFKLEIKEAPAVFMGNVFHKGGGRKKSAIEQLRARMRERLE